MFKYETNRCTLFILLSLIFLINFGKAHAQPALSKNLGVIKGKVKDSVYDFMLTNASIAVYNGRDSSLLKFGLPNNVGEFTIASLPVSVPLKLIISHIGFKTFIKRFEIPCDSTLTDLGIVLMHSNIDDTTGPLEKEVIVTAVAPVHVNRDTIEFNADAFKLDSSATAEDLMRKLPGFTVWGNGDITYNGKKINTVLVDGKPFMGGDLTVATQNLPKIALKKIQIYQQGDAKNPLDSSLYANIKLKETNKGKYFGKLSSSYGSDKKYALDEMLSGFNKKWQFTAVGALNNVNKLATNTEQLLKSSSYTGQDINDNYRSDFSIEGLNNFGSLGALFQYELSPEITYLRSNRVNVDFFSDKNVVNNIVSGITNIILNTDSILRKVSRNRTDQSYSNKLLESNYQKSTPQYKFDLNTNFESRDTRMVVESEEQQKLINYQDETNNSVKRGSTNHRENISVDAEFTNRSTWDGIKRRIPREFTLQYQLSANRSTGNASNLSEYSSSITPNENIKFDRLYRKLDSSGTSQYIMAKYPGLTSLLFPNMRMGGIRTSLSAGLRLADENYFNEILDRDITTNTYKFNEYLSNQRRVVVSDFIPEFNISRLFPKELTNRYSKNLLASITLRSRSYGMRNEASREIQNIGFKYSMFVPDGIIEYHNHQFGDYEADYKLQFLTSVRYPDIDNLAPLVDSANYWNIQYGNKALKPEYTRNLNFSYDITSRRSKNPISSNLEIGVGTLTNKIVDSVVYDRDNRRIGYPINMPGIKFLKVAAGLRKFIEVKTNTIELSLLYHLSVNNLPQYINTILNESRTFNQNITGSATLKYKDVLDIKLEEGVNSYISHQQSFDDSRFSSKNISSNVACRIRIAKDVIFRSDISYNQSKANDISPINFTLWNASIAYRFLKNQQAEIKLSDFDLLKQNTGLSNTSVGNIQIFMTNTVLKHHYLLTISYYPRKF